jgi:hypothetical protein
MKLIGEEDTRDSSSIRANNAETVPREDRGQTMEVVYSNIALHGSPPEICANLFNTMDVIVPCAV